MSLLCSLFFTNSIENPSNSVLFVSAFSVSTSTRLTTSVSPSTSNLFMSAPNGDDDVSRQLEKARKLIAEAKGKLEAKELEAQDPSSTAPVAQHFFATEDNEEDEATREKNKEEKRSRVIKQELDNGKITTDGDMMVELSQNEKWEMRPLMDVFEPEKMSEEDEKSREERRKKEIQIVQAMMNLKQKLGKDDYEKIFNNKNFFIGEE